MSEQQGPSASDKVAESVRKAVNDGIEAVRPTWEEKVAPVVATGAQKAAEWGDAARRQADKKAAELGADDSASSKFLGGALGVGGALAALGSGVLRWVGKKSAESAAHANDASATTSTTPPDETPWQPS